MSSPFIQSAGGVAAELAGLPAAPPANPPTNNVSWKSAVNGDWTTPTDWTGGAVPGATNDVTIGVSGNYTVSITTEDAAHSLTIGNAGVTVADNAGGLALTTKLSLNAGTFALSNGGGVSGGTFAIAAGATLLSSGTNTISSAVTDAGTVTLSDGVLELTGGGSLGGTLSGLGTLQLGGGTFTTSGIAKGGNVDITNGATLIGVKPSGTVVADVTLHANATLSLAAGADLTLSTGLVVGNVNGFDGTGYVSGPGTLTTGIIASVYDGGGNVALSLGGGVTWVTAGTVGVGGIIYMNQFGGDSVTIINAALSSFQLSGDDASLLTPNSGTDRFNNIGTLEKTSGTGTNSIFATITNSGLIQVVSGVIELDAGGSLGGSLSGAGTLGLNAAAFTTSGMATGGTLAVYGGASLTSTLASATFAGAAVLYGGGTLAAARQDGLTFSSGMTVGATGSDVGRGYVSGLGTVTTNGVSTINVNGQDVSLDLGGGVTWVNGGTVNDGGITYLNDSTGDIVSIVNKGSFNFVSDQAQFQLPYTGTDKFSNSGTLAKTGGTGISKLVATIANTGLINVASGVLELDAGGSLGGTLSGAGTLGVGGGTFTTSGISGGGTFAVYGGASLTGTVASGTIAGHAVLIGGGTLAAASHDVLTVSGGMTVGASDSDAGRGYVSGPGTVTTNGVSTINLNGADVSLDLGGGVTWVNGGTVNDGGIVYLNDATNDTVSIVNNGSFNFISDQATFQLPYTGTDSFTNAGTLAKTGGTGISALTATIANTGVINVASGVLELDGGGSLGGTLSGAGTLGLGSGAFTTSGMATGGTLAVYGNASLTGTVASGKFAGAVLLYGGGTLAAASNDVLTVAGSVTVGASGSDAGRGYLSGPGTVTTNGVTTINLNGGDASLDLGGGVTWVNGGTVNDGGITYLNDSTGDSVSIVNNGTFNFVSDQATFQLPYTGTDSFSNAGTLAKTGGAGISYLAAAIANTGLINVARGVLELDAGGSLGGTLSGAGTLGLGSGAFTTSGISGGGTFAVYGGASLTGTVASATLAGHAVLSGGGTLAAASHDVLIVAGGMTVGVAGGSDAGRGYVSGPGTVTTNGASVINVNGADVSLDLGGGVTWVNGGTVSDGGMIYLNDITGDTVSIVNNGTFNLVSDYAQFQLPYTGTDNFANAGVLAKTGGTGTSIFAMNVTNSGTMTAASGVLQVRGGVSNSGLLRATGGGTLDLSQAALSNLSGSTLTGGAYEADAKSVIEFVNDAGLTADNASITLSGAGSAIQWYSSGTGGQVELESSLATITAGGTLSLLSGRNYVAGVTSFGVGGLLSLSGVTFTVKNLAVTAGGTVSGYGKVSAAVADAGTLSAAGGTLVLAGAVSGAGALRAAAAATVDLTKGGALSEAISGAGTLQLSGTTAYTLAGPTISMAAVAIDAGATLSGKGKITGALANSGTVTANGGTLILASAPGGTGVLSAASGATLDLTAGGNFGGSIGGAGTLQLDGATALVMADSSLSVSTVKVDAGATLELTGGGTLAGGLGGAGALQLDSGTFMLGLSPVGTGSVLLDASATLTGSGTISGAVSNSGTVSSASGTLLILGAVSGSGTYATSASSALDLRGGGTLSTVTGAGTLILEGPAGFTEANAASMQIAAIAVDAGASLSTTGTLASGMSVAGTLSASAGTLSLTGVLSDIGTIAAGAGTVLDIKGGGTIAGTLAGSGTVRLDSALTLNSGAALAATTVVQTANVTLGSSTSLTNLAGDSYDITAAAKQTVSLTGAGGDKLSNAGTIAANGAGTASLGVALINSGAITVGSGTLSFVGAVTNNGIIDAAAGKATFSLALGGSGTVEIDHAGTVSLLKGAAASQYVDFGVGGGLLDLTGPNSFAGTIEDFAAGDKIDLIKTLETSYDFANGVLTVMNGSKTVASLHFAGTYATTDFTLASDGHGGTVISHS